MSLRPGLRALNCVIIFMVIPCVFIFKLGSHRTPDPDPARVLHTKGDLGQSLASSYPMALETGFLQKHGK